MAKRVRRITPNFLKKIIVQEARKLRLETLETGVTDPEKVKAEEVDADEFADSLAKDIDHIKVLKIKENRLRKNLKKIQAIKSQLRRRIQKSI
jgi:hypothetical protein